MSDDEPTGDEPTADDDAQAADAEEQPTDDDLPDPKDREDGPRFKRSAHPVEWEAVGREAIVDLLRNQRDAVVRDVDEVIGAIEFGARVDPVHVQHARDAIEALELTIEKRVVPVTREKESWERTVGRVPRGRLYDALDLSREEVNRLKEQREDGGGEDESGGAEE